MAGRGGAPDIAQMLERMPAAKLEDLKPGETVVISSTKGAKSDSITAIMLVANADRLIQIAQRIQAAQQAAGPTLSGLGGGGDLSGLNLPGMIP